MKGTTTRTQEGQEQRLLYSTLFTIFAGGAAAQPLGSFIPFFREEYGLGYDLSGVLLSCQSIGNLIAVLAAGFLPSLLGRRRSVLCTAVWMAVAYGVFLSGIGTGWVLAAACVMTGIARGGNSTFGNTMMSTLPGDMATRGYNLLHGGYAMGALISPLLLVFITARWPKLGWRAVAALLLALCLAQVAVYATMPIPEKENVSGQGKLDIRFLKNGRFWLGAAMLLFYVSTEYAIMGWLVTYFQDIAILSDSQSQMMSSLVWLLMFLGRMAGAAMVGKVSRSLILVVDGVGLLIFFLIMYSAQTASTVVLGLVGVGLFMATIYPSAFAVGSECIKGNDLGCSVMSFIGSAGGVLTPVLVGFVAERAGIRAGIGLIVVFIGLLLGSILLSVFCVRPRRTTS